MEMMMNIKVFEGASLLWHCLEEIGVVMWGYRRIEGSEYLYA